MQGYVNANFAGDLDKRRSTMGYVFQNRNGLISWMSKLQVMVALSITDIGYTNGRKQGSSEASKF